MVHVHAKDLRFMISRLCQGTPHRYDIESSTIRYLLFIHRTHTSLSTSDAMDDTALRARALDTSSHQYDAAFQLVLDLQASQNGKGKLGIKEQLQEAVLGLKWTHQLRQRSLKATQEQCAAYLGATEQREKEASLLVGECAALRTKLKQHNQATTEKEKTNQSTNEGGSKHTKSSSSPSSSSSSTSSSSSSSFLIHCLFIASSSSSCIILIFTLLSFPFPTPCSFIFS
jgi:hypothetical protein